MPIVNPNGSRRLERMFYTVPEVAEMFGVSRKTVYDFLKRGLLHASSAIRHKRIARTSVESFVARTVNNGGGQ